ncbi:UNVERIFIED_CONTAM: hypothetical protein NCL1_23684 [Trichonephila clavipes]
MFPKKEYLNESDKLSNMTKKEFMLYAQIFTCHIIFWSQEAVECGRWSHGRLYGRHGSHESFLQSQVTMPTHYGLSKSETSELNTTV